MGSTADNLKSAIAGEQHEYRYVLVFLRRFSDTTNIFVKNSDMYPGMAKVAREEGFDDIAEWFETLARAEKSHAGRFQKALDKLE